MARVAVAHPQFTLSGGAEAVALNILEAIETDHEVTLLTTTPVNLMQQNEYHGTNISEVNVHHPRVFHALDRMVDGRFGVLRYALLNRYVRRHESKFDLVVSSFNEFESTRPCICYFHHPIYDRSGLEHDVQTDSHLRRGYKRLAAGVAGINADSLSSTISLSNSDWTATMVERIYGIRPETVYPPVDVSKFNGARASSAKREDGFVSIGRIAPDKNILRNIEIVKRIRERGHDIHLHIVGPIQSSGYYERVREAADPSFVSIEGAVSRKRLIELVSSHRYGLHGKEYEHFGMVVVEMIAGGMLPFLPATGGQTEIVDGDPRVLYESTADAVETVDRVISNPDMENNLRQGLADRPEQYSRGRFQRQFSNVVDRALQL